MATATARLNRWAIVAAQAQTPIRESARVGAGRLPQCPSEFVRRLHRLERRRGGEYVPMDLYFDTATAENEFQFAPDRKRSERRRDPLGRRFMV
jgi:hypothetical protein